MRLSQTDRENMLSLLKAGTPAKLLAEQFGITPSAIYHQVRKLPEEIRVLIESQCYKRAVHKKNAEENPPIKVGRKKLNTKDVATMLKDGVPKREMAKILGVSPNTLYTFIKSYPKLLKITNDPPISQKKRNNLDLSEKLFDLLEKGHSIPEVLEALSISLIRFRYLASMFPDKRRDFCHKYWTKIEKAVLENRRKYHSGTTILPKTIKSFFDMKRQGHSSEEIQEALGNEVCIISINIMIVDLGFYNFSRWTNFSKNKQRRKTENKAEQ